MPDVGTMCAAEPTPQAAALALRYRYWQQRIMVATLVGYALFYLVRKNLPAAMPAMEASMGIRKADLGLFLTLHGVVYGVSKFANGFLGDRLNPRWFMASGLLLSAGLNLALGWSTGAVMFGVLWMINGWFQGMGFPPCARSLTHWFSPAERATRFGVWNTSHSIGTVVALVLCGQLVTHWGWKACFWVPGVIAAIGAVWLVMRLRDTPQSLGLPVIEDYSIGASTTASELDESSGRFREVLRERVFGNPMVWMVSLATFFVYTVRYALLDWGPTILLERKGVAVAQGTMVIAAYELSGVAGMLLSGWLTDRLFRGRAARACAAWMVLCGIGVTLFWHMPTRNPLIYTAVLCLAGFSIYGPQCLVGVIAANLATRRAAATAIGLTGLFGYLSTVLSGWGLGLIADHYGWNPVFYVLIGAVGAAIVLFVVCWNAVAPEVAEVEQRA